MKILNRKGWLWKRSPWRHPLSSPQKNTNQKQTLPSGYIYTVELWRSSKLLTPWRWDLGEIWAYHAHLSPSLLCPHVSSVSGQVCTYFTASSPPSSPATSHKAVEGEAFLKFGFFPCSLWSIVTRGAHKVIRDTFSALEHLHVGKLHLLL